MRCGVRPQDFCHTPENRLFRVGHQLIERIRSLYSLVIQVDIKLLSAGKPADLALIGIRGRHLAVLTHYKLAQGRIYPELHILIKPSVVHHFSGAERKRIPIRGAVEIGGILPGDPAPVQHGRRICCIPRLLQGT